MNFSLPTQISAQFHIVRTLKDGERSRVLLLRHRQDGSRCICKQFAGSAEVYRLLQQVHSPHLPHVEAVVEDEDSITVLEEYIRGDTLAFLLQEGPLTEEQTQAITLQLCTALEILHGYGVVHRDIKPENVIIRGDTAVLIDFDASRVEKPTHSSDTQIMGTAGYAAPEQYGFSQTDARSDIYAMGVLMNVMLTKQHPATCLAEGPFQPVVQKCIEVNADRRFGCVEELVQALKKADAPPPKHKRWKRIVLAAAVCLLVGSVFGSKMQQTNSTPTTQVTEPTIGEQLINDVLQTYVPDRDTVSILQNKVGDAQIVSPTQFTYDLDGDGEQEEYLFGVTFASPVSMYGDVIIDEMIGVFPGDVPGRKVVPCVWRYLEDGSLEMELAFCKLLTDASTTVHFLENPDGTRCSAIDYRHRWPGGIEVRFPPDTIGTWVYTVSATLGTQTLTAQGSTVIVYQ